MPLDLDALLNPGSLAILGASGKPESAGWAMVEAARSDGFAGPIYPINPRYEQIDGLNCYPDLTSLPDVPDHVVVGLGNPHLSETFDALSRAGVRAATVFASGQENGTAPLDDLRQKAADAGITLCGPNCMGLLNPAAGLRVAAFKARGSAAPGGIVWLAQSGSAFSALTYNQPRLGLKLAVSTGSEWLVDVADYMHWSLDQEGTRVIGLFLEGIRNPERFVSALEKALARNVPVVVLKVGRTTRSAEMAASHTGALAGNDGAYQALFRRYNVVQVTDFDEMAAVLALLDTPKRYCAGKLATMHDSGGERELLVDLAEATGVPFAKISDETKAAIQPNLDNGLDADNPLDAWGTAQDFEARFTACADALLSDPAVSTLGFFSDPRDGHGYHDGMVRSVVEAARKSRKPVFIASNTSMTDDEGLHRMAGDNGVPLIKGTRAALTAVSKINALTGFRPDAGNTSLNMGPTAHLGMLSETRGLALLADAGVSVPAMRQVETIGALGEAAAAIDPPYVLKTDEGLAHKSDRGGVVVGLQDADALRNAYEDMAERLGPKALVMEMAPNGVEIGLGAFVDPGFGPVVAVSAGGVMIEVFRDVQFALAPFGTATARNMVDALAVSAQLAPHRGRAGADVEALCATIARFSELTWSLRDTLQEVDVNPLIVSPEGAVAVDALFIFKES